MPERTESWEERFDEVIVHWDIASSVRPLIKNFIRSLLNTAKQEGRGEEKQAWLDNNRCRSCGDELDGHESPMNNVCIPCWEAA